MSDLEVYGKKIIRLRKAEIEDIPFVTNSWLASYRKSLDCRGIPNTEFYHYEHQILENLIPDSMLVILCPEHDHDHIWGWGCYQVIEQGDTGQRLKVLVLHYVLVREAYQKLGLARQLVDNILALEKPDGVVMTYRTKDSFKALQDRREVKDWRFNPYLRYKEYLHE